MAFTMPPPVCPGSGYACFVPQCPGGSTTSVTGKVYDPSGKTPVYGALLYIPDQPDQVVEISKGPSNLCGRCVQPTGSPIAGAVTAPDGSFRLSGTPVGHQIPLVVQLGKWRRMTFVSIPSACAENPISDPELARLPKSRSDGQKVSLPKIAIAAGAADRLQCLLLRMGIDPTEFTNPDGAGSITIYNQPQALGSDPGGRYAPGYSGGAAFPDAAAFWSDLGQLSKYDIVLLACGGNQAATDPTRTVPNPISDTAKANMVKYMASGGRVLGEHYNWAWIKSYSSKGGQGQGSYPSPLEADVASWHPYLDPSEPASAAVPAGTTVSIPVDTSFPKGKDFADWLLAAKATSLAGTFPLTGEVKRTAVDQLVTAPSAQRWLYQPASADDAAGAAEYVHHLSFNLTSSGQVIDRRTVDATNLCGRFVYTGLHVDSGDTSAHASDLSDENRAAPFPTCCAAGSLAPAEKAIEFMILDLSSCLSLDASRVVDSVLF